MPSYKKIIRKLTPSLPTVQVNTISEPSANNPLLTPNNSSKKNPLPVKTSSSHPAGFHSAYYNISEYSPPSASEFKSMPFENSNVSDEPPALKPPPQIKSTVDPKSMTRTLCCSIL